MFLSRGLSTTVREHLIRDAAAETNFIKYAKNRAHYAEDHVCKYAKRK